MISNEFAWAVGLFEGEGCIHAGRKGPRGGSRSHRRLALKMNDRAVVERFAAAVGCGKVSKPQPYGSAGKAMHTWYLYRTEEILGLLNRMEPLLSERRRNQMAALRAGV